jgi:hypothetical protein
MFTIEEKINANNTEYVIIIIKNGCYCDLYYFNILFRAKREVVPNV